MKQHNLKDSRAASIAERLLAAAGVAAIIAGAGAVAYFNPATQSFFPQCPLHALTGLNCPGCGLTRGFHALFRGDAASALHFNLLIPIYAAIFGYFLLSLVLFAVRGRGLSFKVFSPTALGFFLVLSLIFAVVRNLPFYPFNWLAI